MKYNAPTAVKLGRAEALTLGRIFPLYVESTFGWRLWPGGG